MRIAKKPADNRGHSGNQVMIAREDIVLLWAAVVANAPGPGRIEWKAEGDRRATELIDRVVLAVIRKHGCAIDKKGNRKDTRDVCRQLVIDILARKKSLTPYHQIIGAFAARNDKDFFTALGRGFDQRKAVFDDIEWFMLFRDGELTDEQVAERFGKTLSAIHSKRQRLGLAARC